MKRTLKAILLTVLLLLLAGSVLLYRLSGIGESGLEAWIGAELQKAVNVRGDIVLKFSSIDYQAPNRIVLENLHLSRPGKSGKDDLELVSVQRAQIDLGGLPHRNKPLVISAVELSTPTVHVDALLAPDPNPDRPKPTTRPQLSTVLKLKRVAIENGTIDYNDRSGEAPMSWTGLNVQLDLDENDVVWHDAHVVLDQSPLIKLELSGQVNIDEAAVRQLAMALDVNLTDEKSRAFLAPRVQQLLNKFEVRGQMAVRANGDASLNDPAAASLNASVALTDGNVTVGSYHLPLERLDLAASVRDRIATLERCNVNVINGTVRADGTVQLDGIKQVNLQAMANDLDLQKLLRDQSDPAAAKRKMSGLLNAHIISRPTLDLLRLFGKPEGNGVVWASGYTRVRNGRLVNLPVIGQIISMTRRVTNVVTGGEVYRDELQAQFLGVGKRLDFRDIQYFGDVVAARGRGTIAFDGGLDLTVNAGPLEGLQQYLGAVGRVWGNISDRLLAYSVKGNVKEPIIRPLFGGAR